MKIINKHNYKSYKYFHRVLLSFSNISRSLLINVFGLLVNYIILKFKGNELLSSYVYCISIINLFFIITNWGGKDFITKTLISNSLSLTKLVGTILESKFLFCLLALLLLLFLPFTKLEKLFVFLFLCFKTVQPVFESLIVIKRKSHFFLLIDLIIILILILMLLIDIYSVSLSLLFALIIITEFLRLLCYIFIFYKSIAFSFSFINIVNILKKSCPFFYISIAGFLCSKADLYVLVIVQSKSQMSLYFIIINLVIVCQIGYASFINTFSPTLYRMSNDNFNKTAIITTKIGFIVSLLSALFVFVFCTYYYNININIWFCFLIVINVFSFTLILQQMYKHTRLANQHIILIILLVSGLLNIVYAFYFVNILGYQGAFLSNTLTIITSLILFKIYNRYAKC